MPDWVEKVITASPAAIFAVMWWLERTERVAIMERALTAMLETKGALLTLVSILKPDGRGDR